MIYNKFGGPERGEYFLHRLERLYRQEPARLSSLRPNRYTYSLVLDAIAKSQTPSAAERAEDLLNAMLVSATSAAATEDNSGGGGGGVVVEPDTTVYNTVLNAWARSKSPQAVERAEGIMQTMRLRQREGLSTARPDIFTYNTMLNILARSARGYHGARKLVDQMEKNHRYHHNRRRRDNDKNNNNNDSDDAVAVAPNVVSYNILIKALADDVSVTNATEKALAILDAIRTISSDDEGVVDDDAPRPNRRRRLNCALDSVTYSSVLRVMSRDSSKEQPQYAEQAIALLHELEAAYDASNDPALAPNSILYTQVRCTCTMIVFVSYRSHDSLTVHMISDIGRPSVQSHEAEPVPNGRKRLSNEWKRGIDRAPSRAGPIIFATMPSSTRTRGRMLQGGPSKVTKCF
jgi:pentatricopeptide repeat protein